MFAGIGGAEEGKADTCDGRWCSRSAMEAARAAAFQVCRRDRRRRRWFTLHAEVVPAATAVIAVAGQGDEGFLVAEHLTQKMGQDRPPHEACHCKRQFGSGERLSRRQWSWFCHADPSQIRSRDTGAAAHPFAAASTASNDGSVMLDSTPSSRLSSSDAASRSTRAVSRSSSYPGYRCPRRQSAWQP